MNGADIGLPFEQFIQAITSQLDRAQRAMAVKARNSNLPLTFAVKDLALDLRTHIEMRGAAIYLRPAGPNEPQASTIHLQLTTITRPMIDENSVPVEETPDEEPVDRYLGDDLRDEERDDLQRRLEWAGIQRVSQLRQVQRLGQQNVLQRITQLPATRLRAALERVTAPRVDRVVQEPAPQDLPPFEPPRPIESFRPAEPASPPSLFPRGHVSPGPMAPRPPAPEVGVLSPRRPPALLRIHGENLVRAAAPVVKIRGEIVPVLKASEKELLIAPKADLMSGSLSVEVEPGVVAQAELCEGAPTHGIALPPAEPPGNGGNAP